MADVRHPAPAEPANGRARQRRHVVGPIILIGLGALFLAQNMGWVSGNIWLSIWRLWPLMLVIAGVELLLGRSTWGAAVSAVVAIAALGAVALVALQGNIPYLGQGSWAIQSLSPARVERVAEDLGEVKQARIDLRHNAGQLQVSALPADSPRLVEAALSHPEDSTIYNRFDRRGDRAELRLRDPDRHDFPFVGNNYRDDWTVRLSPKVLLELQIETGASELNLDLRDLLVAQLNVEAGASAVDVTLPQAAGRTSASIKAGAAGVEVIVPSGVAARIRAEGGLSGITIDQNRFPRVGNYYQSPDYETAENRVDLHIETGVSGVTVR